MKITPLAVTIRDLIDGYVDNDEEGVYGYGGKLNIRPKYQREFVYSPKDSEAVIRSICQGFPLNSMYWRCAEDGSYEMLDGQQRTISICHYLAGDFSIEFTKDIPQGFENLSPGMREDILRYPLTIYLCSGSYEEALKWFETINIAGKRLTKQELRNAFFAGTWLTDAKRHFSKSQCVAVKVAGKYMTGNPIRQEYLETVLNWIADRDSMQAQEYMQRHQHDPNAEDLWIYFEKVIAWVEKTFPNYRKKMKGVDWGFLYNAHKDDDLDPVALEAEVKRLIMDDDVTNKSGVYSYVLDGDERHLNIRLFTDAMRTAAYERQNGVCRYCHKPFPIEEMDADHIKPWSKGGPTTADNCQMLCRDCNIDKSNK